MERPFEVRLARLFGAVIEKRWLIIVAYAVILPLAAILASGIERDNSLENMVVPSDPDVAECRRFQELFPEQTMALLMLETVRPFSSAALGDLRVLQQELDDIDGLTTFSIASVWSQIRPGGGLAESVSDQVREFVSGTDFFRRQGLVGDDFLGVVLAMDVDGPEARDVMLAAIERVLETTASSSQTIDNIRKVGTPWVDAWLEYETAASSARYFPLFGAFVVVLMLGLYRSWRALAAILISLGAAVLLGMAFAGLVGLSFTIVSALVPLTLLVTATASLVYLHSRFVDQPDGVDLEKHRCEALANKFVAVSASVFAAAVGFAALIVSDIRPIRELGIWTSGGLMFGWIVCFSLYPALQKVLRTPTRRQRRIAGGWVERAAEVLPLWSYRYRWPLVLTATVLSLAGLVALLGFPGVVPGMSLETDALAYIDADSTIAEDSRYFEENVLGLATAKVWITTPPEMVLEPEFLMALDQLTTELQGEAAVGSVVGLPSLLGLRRYAAGLGDELPTDPAAFRRMTADLEMLLLTEPALAQWVDLGSLSSTYLTVTSSVTAQPGMGELTAAVEAAWLGVVEKNEALAECSYRLVGTGVLQETIARHLVPTLSESFAITFSIIFVTFIFVFRSGAARLNAMVPSLFAILGTFLFMRVTGIPLNVATILIATTVLGVTENDQIHFFYHFLERRKNGTTEEALGHAIRVAGHAILFATLINASGFLALSLSDLPPMRQFGIITSLAFVLAMIADFTALPAALWIFFREKPTSLVEGGERPADSIPGDNGPDDVT